MADPVQDFLARERNALAELEGDAPVFNEPSVNIAEDNFDAFQQPPPHINGIMNSGGDSGVDLVALNLNGESPAPTQNGRGPSPTVSISSMRSQPEPAEEPEKMRKWREDQKKRLEEKDAAEEKKKQELRDQAKKELEDWNKQRLAKLEEAKKKNKEREVTHQNGDDFKDGDQWDRIAKMVESGPKTNKSTKDTSRMKEMLLQMVVEKVTS